MNLTSRPIGVMQKKQAFIGILLLSLALVPRTAMAELNDGSLVKEGDQLNFVVVVLSDEHVKEVFLEPPRAAFNGRRPLLAGSGGRSRNLGVAFALRRQRSHVRIVSGAPILSGIFVISTLTENSRCHHSVTDNFKLAKAARGSFLVTRPQRPR